MVASLSNKWPANFLKKWDMILRMIVKEMTFPVDFNSMLHILTCLSDIQV